MARVKLVPFTREYLDASWNWLNDSETKHLTMTPDFTRDDQDRFFESLPRDDYRIWGLELDDGSPVGAAGLKAIHGQGAEYWGYIGDPTQRGQGLGRQMLALTEAEARQLGIMTLKLLVQDFNTAAIRLYRCGGYQQEARNGSILTMRKELEGLGIRLVPFSRDYLDRSWDWLRDPEIKEMTMAGDFTRQDQIDFFESLPRRRDYKIWGVETATGAPIGAAGLKHIGGRHAEFWCYIGERDYWGQGLGGQILEACEAEAGKSGISRLTMIAQETNQRSIRAYEKMGFVFVSRDNEQRTLTLAKSL